MLLQDSARQKKGNTIAFTVALILIVAVLLLLFLM
jgi:competence protein ComGC